jgi:hypothetical protein
LTAAPGQMASAEWVEIYGGYAPDELDAEPAALKE